MKKREKYKWERRERKRKHKNRMPMDGGSIRRIQNDLEERWKKHEGANDE